MAKRRDNMLEAFQASSAHETQGDGGSAAGGGGSTPERSPSDATGGMTLPMGPGPFLLLQVVLLVLAFMAGQASDGSGKVQAQERVGDPADVTLEGPASVRDPSGTAVSDSGSAQSQATSPVSPQAPSRALSQASTAPNGGVLSTRPGRSNRGARRPAAGSEATSVQGQGGNSASGALSVADAAFADPANRFTLLVFTADGTDFGRERASANHANLSAQGFAVITPRERGGKVLLQVGAFGSFAAAEQVRTKVAAAPGPDGRQTPYAGAYVVNITR
jgi:hypothetical protein